MKEWFTAADIAGLEELPRTERRIRSKANRENWKKRKRTKGKGFEYHISSLPDATQKHIRHHQAVATANELMQQKTHDNVINPEIVPDVKTREQLADEQAEKAKMKARSMAEFASIPKCDRRKRRALARRRVLDSFWAFRRGHHYTKRAALAGFTDAFFQGDIHVPDWVLEMMPVYNKRRGFTIATLIKWEHDYDMRGIMGLTDGYGNRAHQSIIETTEALFRLVLGAMVKAPQISGPSMIAFIKAKNEERQKNGAEQIPVPSIRTYQRFRVAWIEANHQLWTKITNPDLWKNIYMAAAGSHFEKITALNMLWELDSTPADWMLKDGRHSVVGVIDLWSRRLKFYVSKTSKAMAVCQLTRWAILAWGMPGAVRTDNGQDYISDQYELVLHDLEIIHEICIPFASEEKGTIERSMRTMSHGILNLLPGFIGHNVAERKQIEARKSFAKRIMTPGEVIEVEMTADDLQKHLDDWCEHVYGKDVHSGIGMSPFNKARSWTGPARRIEDERAMDMLLCELGGVRVITKKGIRFNNHTYFNDSIGLYIGKQVLLKYDERDIGHLYAYVDEQFIGVVICHEILGISRKEAAAAVKAKQKRHMAEKSREIRAYGKAIKQNIAETVLEHRITQSENIVAIPHASEAHTTHALDEAGKAAREGDEPTATPLTEEEQAVYERLQVDDAAEKDNVIDLPDNDPVATFRLFRRLADAVERGEPIKPAEQRFIDSYAGTLECESMERFCAAE